MGNCLVTKLKDAVDNNSIEVYGEIEVPLAPNCVLNTLVNTPCTFAVAGDGYFTFYNTDQSVYIDNLTTYNTGEYTGWMNILNKTDSPITIKAYSIRYNHIVAFELYNYNNAGTSTSNKNVLRQFTYSQNMTKLHLNNLNISNDVDDKDLDLKIFENLTNLSLLSFLNTRTSGNITSLYKLSNLNTISVGTTTHAQGDFLDFAILQIREIGRESANISSSWSGALKFNGENIPNYQYNLLSWSKSGSHYIINYVAGENVQSIQFNRSVEIDENFNIIN
jgi:hypothetical protein